MKTHHAHGCPMYVCREVAYSPLLPSLPPPLLISSFLALVLIYLRMHTYRFTRRSRECIF